MTCLYVVLPDPKLFTTHPRINKIIIKRGSGEMYGLDMHSLGLYMQHLQQHPYGPHSGYNAMIPMSWVDVFESVDFTHFPCLREFEVYECYWPVKEKDKYKTNF